MLKDDLQLKPLNCCARSCKIGGDSSKDADIE